MFLGTYHDEELAARAFDRAAIRFRGANAKTNFPILEYGDMADIMALGEQELPPRKPKGRPRINFGGYTASVLANKRGRILGAAVVAQRAPPSCILQQIMGDCLNTTDEIFEVVF